MAEKYKYIDYSYPQVTPCLFGQHVWEETGVVYKHWTSNKSDSIPPETCRIEKQKKCINCGEVITVWQ